MVRRLSVHGFALLAVCLAACSSDEEDPGANDPAQLVGKWSGTDPADGTSLAMWFNEDGTWGSERGPGTCAHGGRWEFYFETILISDDALTRSSVVHFGIKDEGKTLRWGWAVYNRVDEIAKHDCPAAP